MFKITAYIYNCTMKYFFLCGNACTCEFSLSFFFFDNSQRVLFQYYFLVSGIIKVATLLESKWLGACPLPPPHPRKKEWNLQSVTLELGSIEGITFTCCARPPFPCPFQCWPWTWTIPPKNHYKTTLEERKAGTRAEWPKLSALDCPSSEVHFPTQTNF